VLECVLNVSEGRDAHVLAALAEAAGNDLLDLHRDPHHNRAVLTVVGQEAPRAVATSAIERIDLRRHEGVHPRLGVVDVVPFVALEGSADRDALAARDAFAAWLASEHGVPCFLYGPERSLPEVRRHAFTELVPDRGPPAPHLTAGATAVGARAVLVAYNVWLSAPDVGLARRVASAVRGPALRALGLSVGERAQVSMNLIEPSTVGPADAFDLVERLAVEAGGAVAGAELVGLVPRAVLDAIDPSRWAALDLSPDRTVEARLAARSR
jgi:glutamate formiminotransferase